MPILIFSKRGERMRQSARHIYVPHGNEVYVNNWCAWRIREYTIKKILKNRSSRDFFNFIYCVSRGFRPDHEIQNRHIGRFLFCFLILTPSSRVVFFKNVIFSPFSNFFIFLSCFLVPYVFALLCQSSNWTHRNNPMPFRTSINIICRIVNYL